MYKILVLLILLCFCSCSCITPLTEEEVRIQEYGELYFTMDCWWSSQELIAPAYFHCSENVSTELISGYVSLAVAEDLNGEEYFSICGKDIVLKSGYSIHDDLIFAMTQYTYNCYDSYERELGNEFDWIWSNEDAVLQLIWRPDYLPDQVLTLFIPEKTDSPRVLGSVYYKTGYFN